MNLRQMCQSGGGGGPEYWPISVSSHSVTVAASRRTYDNDPHLRPHKTKPGVCVVGVGVGGGGCRNVMCLYAGRTPAYAE